MIAQGQTDMPSARARSTRGLNKKESICSECVCEEAGQVGVAEAADGRAATVAVPQFLR